MHLAIHPKPAGPNIGTAPDTAAVMLPSGIRFAFVPETHMLKPYDQRVKATYALMQCFIEFTAKNSEKIKNLRDQTKQSVKSQMNFPSAGHWIVHNPKCYL